MKHGFVLRPLPHSGRSPWILAFNLILLRRMEGVDFRIVVALLSPLPCALHLSHSCLSALWIASFPAEPPQFLRCAVSHEPDTCGEFSGPENAGAMYTRAVELPALKYFSLYLGRDCIKCTATCIQCRKPLRTRKGRCLRDFFPREKFYDPRSSACLIIQD